MHSSGNNQSTCIVLAKPGSGSWAQTYYTSHHQRLLYCPRNIEAEHIGSNAMEQHITQLQDTATTVFIGYGGYTLANL